MGGSVSTGKDNDDLVDNLKESHYIKSTRNEKIFRVVDRADYILLESRSHAYRDTAWREGTLHLSAPCIYAEVMESLKLEEGQAFLNIGSGTGYLSTMVGLALGSRGINHGVEIHEANVKYANERLRDFLSKSVALRYFDFAQPRFIAGNGFALSASGCRKRYDRIYIGAACDDTADVKFFADFLKIGGMLIVPVDSNLVRVKRVSESLDDLSVEALMSCSFASMLPKQEDMEPITFPPEQLRSLKMRTREVITDCLRTKVLAENPDLVMPRTFPRTNGTSTDRPRVRRVLYPLLLAQGGENEEPHLVLGDPINSDEDGESSPSVGNSESDSSNHPADADGPSTSDQEGSWNEPEPEASESGPDDGNGAMEVESDDSDVEADGSEDSAERNGSKRRGRSQSQASDSRQQPKRRTLAERLIDRAREMSAAAAIEREKKASELGVGTPSEEVPASIRMEAKMVQAIKNLNVAPALARFINFDRPLD